MSFIIKNITKTLNKIIKVKLLLILLFSSLIPFLELLSIGSIATLVLYILELDSYLDFVPKFITSNYLLNLEKSEILYFLSFILLGAILLKNLFLLYYHYFENLLKKNIAAYHSERLFDNFINNNYLEHTYIGQSNVQNEILFQAKKCSDFIFQFTTLIKDSLICFILVISLFFINFKASFILISLSLLVSACFFYLTGKKMRSIGGIVKDKEGEIIEIVRNTFEGFKIVVLFRKKNFFKSNFANILRSQYRYEVIFQLVQKIPRLLFEVVFVSVIILVLLNFISNNGELKEIMPFLVLLSLVSIRVLPIIVNLNSVYSALKYNEKPVQDLITDLLNKKIDKDKSFEIETNEKNKNLYKNLGKIDVRNLTFGFKSKKHNLFENISFSLEANKIYGLVGTTGVGKSTLLDILMGIISPLSGNVYADNIDINKNLDEWYKCIGYVPQDNFLLNKSILDNVCFAEKKDSNKEKFKTAIKLSELEDFIQSLPQKEGTVVGDRGIQISGGQKQRIGLARALYEERKFLAFDEATSAVDSATESNILKTLHKIKKNKIIVIIAHRENTIQSCDHKIKLINGKIELS